MSGTQKFFVIRSCFIALYRRRPRQTALLPRSIALSAAFNRYLPRLACLPWAAIQMLGTKLLLIRGDPCRVVDDVVVLVVIGVSEGSGVLP
jgi:hypothetical protein